MFTQSQRRGVREPFKPVERKFASVRSETCSHRLVERSKAVERKITRPGGK